MKKLLAIALIASSLFPAVAEETVADILPQEPWLLVTFVPPVNIPVPWDSRSADVRFNDYVVRGVDVGLIYSSCPSVWGLSFGCVTRSRLDMRGLQLCAWGITHDGYGAQACALSYSASDFYGSQFGVYNGCDGFLRGAEIGIYNDAERLSGVQIGLVNVCNDLNGIQLGLVNVNRLGRFHVLPLMNMRF